MRIERQRGGGNSANLSQQCLTLPVDLLHNLTKIGLAGSLSTEITPQSAPSFHSLWESHSVSLSPTSSLSVAPVHSLPSFAFTSHTAFLLSRVTLLSPSSHPPCLSHTVLSQSHFSQQSHSLSARVWYCCRMEGGQAAQGGGHRRY